MTAPRDPDLIYIVGDVLERYRLEVTEHECLRSKTDAQHKGPHLNLTLVNLQVRGPLSKTLLVTFKEAERFHTALGSWLMDKLISGEVPRG